jgi:hypothetical protein
LFGGVVDTGDKFRLFFWLFLTGINVKKFIAGVNFSPVSTTPANSVSPVLFTPAININSRTSPQIFEKIQNGPKGILMGLGDTDS